MGSFPALAINTQGESPLNMLSQVERIKGERQSQEMGSIQLEEARAAQQSRMTLTSLFAKNAGDMNQTLADAKASGKVTPTDLINFQTHAVDMQTKATQLSEAQLALESKTNDVLVNHLESFKQLPQDARTPDTVKGLMSGLSSQGVDISKYIPAFQSLAQNPTDDNIKTIELGLKGRQWVTENEKSQREAASAPTPEQAHATYQANFEKIQAETNKDLAEKDLAITKAANEGQVTPAIRFQQSQENYRATLARQASFGNTLYKDGLDKVSNLFADPQHGYMQFAAQAANTKSAVMQARNGSELAASLEPTMVALGLSSFAGVHRINPTEADAAGPGVGSAARKLQSILDKVGQGKVPEDTLKEVDALVDGMVDARYGATVDAARMVAANTKVDPTKLMVMDRNGHPTTLDKVDSTPQAGKTAAPTTPSIKVGDTVTLKNGTQIKVKAVHPDGSFD